MSKDKETPEERRERLRQREKKSNPTGNLNESLNRGANGSLVDLVGALGWKGTGIGLAYARFTHSQGAAFTAAGLGYLLILNSFVMIVVIAVLAIKNKRNHDLIKK